MVSFLKSGKTHVAGAEVISGSAIFLQSLSVYFMLLTFANP